MATIRKRGNKYHVQIRKQGHPALTKTFSTRASAETWARRIESDIERGQYLDISSARHTPLASLLERYRNEVLPLKRGTTQEQSRIKHLTQSLGHLSLFELKPHVISRYRDARLETVQQSTVRRELGLLRRILNTAFNDWGITLPSGNPVSMIRMPLESKGRERRLSNDEEERLRDALSASPLMRDIVSFALETAMRRGEIASMTWEHTNLDSRVLFIPESKTDTPRHVPLSTRATQILVSKQNHHGGLVWNIRPDSITQAFERACARTAIQGLRFHDLRHEATSRLFERGLSVMEVASITGHKDIRMLRRYTHLRATDLLKKLG